MSDREGEENARQAAICKAADLRQRELFRHRQSLCADQAALAGSDGFQRLGSGYD